MDPVDAHLQPFLANLSATDFCLNGARGWFVDQGNGMDALPMVGGLSESEFKSWVIGKISLAGKSWDAKSPYLDFIFQNDFRGHAIFPPLSKEGVILSLRRLPRASADQVGVSKVDEICARWSESSAAFTLLRKAYSAHESILLCGATGSGKTTLLNDLVSFSCSDARAERIIALEDTPELAPKHPHFISLTSRVANADGFGAVTLRDLLKQCLRMRPDRILLGECRGGEVLDLLQALNTGHRGTLATLHANSARDALRRLELLVLLGANGQLPLSLARDLIASGIQWIAHLGRGPDGVRKIQQVIKIEGKEGDTILSRPMQI